MEKCEKFDECYHPYKNLRRPYRCIELFGWMNSKGSPTAMCFTSCAEAVQRKMESSLKLKG